MTINQYIMTENLLRPSVSVRSVLSGPHEDILVLQRDTDGEWELPAVGWDRVKASLNASTAKFVRKHHFL